MIIHAIKCERSFFDATVSGEKTFTVRKDDRNYQVGDLLAVNEIVHDPKPTYTGRCCLLKINYILDDPTYCKEGTVILGYSPCWICAHLPASVAVYPEVRV